MPLPEAGCCRVAYTLETMKNGSIVETRDVSSRSHYIFGRTDACDFQLEHPSISRLHAVLQFSPAAEAFLYDAGSAHGSFLNKQKLKAQVHVPLRCDAWSMHAYTSSAALLGI